MLYEVITVPFPGRDQRRAGGALPIPDAAVGGHGLRARDAAMGTGDGGFPDGGHGVLLQTSALKPQQVARMECNVITSYSIHYTKLYDVSPNGYVAL